MRLFGILLIVLILLAGGGYVYLATQDWKGRQQINAAGLRHLLLLQGLPVEGADFSADDETPFEVPVAGGEVTSTVSKKLLESYFRDDTAGVGAPVGGGEQAPARLSLAANTPVTSQVGEVKRVLGLLKGEIDKTQDTAQKIALVEGWLLIQAETMNERIQYQEWASRNDKAGAPKSAEKLAVDADSLLHALDRKFYRVAPKLYTSDSVALAPAKWQEMQKQGEGADAAQLKPPVSTDDADRRVRLAHLFVHLDRDAAWQRRVAVVVGLRRYVAAITAQTIRFREMRSQVDLPLAVDQASFQKAQDYLLNETRQKVDQARLIADEKAKLVEQKTAADDAVSRRQTQLAELRAQLLKVRAEIDEQLVRQTGFEKQLYEIQREVSLTLEEVYRLDALLVDIERERYGFLPRQPK
ncbi:unnamed protein product [Gemmata massiliana]|uniref:Uncharacterized protein n=1 Tax=Gemmata massiliana TaxID=1210884 RepID=A0A6P2CQ91_9BACT|nr:hypothetical protein [Gemmata massiliana]VTR91019.1 unnamed protein product [Gemmata massiliana]